MTHWTSRGIAAAALLGLLLIPAASARARNGTVVQLPSVGVKMKSGLTLQIDSRGADANGYRPFKVKVANSSGKAAKYDRQVRVTMEIQGYGAYGRVAVSKVLEIPEGATSAETIISVPHDGRASYFNLETREGGQILQDLSAKYLTVNSFGGWGGGDEAFPSILFVSSATPLAPDREQLVSQNAAQVTEKEPTRTLPDFRNVLAATHDANANGSQAEGKISDRSLLSLLDTYPRLDMLPPAELHQRWLDFSCYGIIFISRRDLGELSAKYPVKASALREWLAGGCVMVVYDAGEKFEHLPEIEKLLALAPQPEAGEKGVPYRGWLPAKDEHKVKRMKYYGNSPNYYNRVPVMSQAMTVAETPVPSPPETPVAISKNPVPFVARPAMFGWVIAVPDENPFPGDVDTWEWMFNSIPQQRESWNYRHGLTLIGNNDGFWNWHIAGVGAAPVFSFILLATLFAIAIGPLNYLILGKMQRLSMLLFTVPAGALLVTLALFLYALATDGIGVRSRVRSFTMIDQRRGQMASWSRQSYFASIAPSRGLKFPEDTTVVPLVQKPSERGQHYRAIDWERDGQVLKSGFISSRSLQQFMVLRSGKTQSRLDIKERETTPRLQVRNELGTKIHLLVVRDSRGDYYSAPEFPPDATAEPAKIPSESARESLSKLIKARELRYPEGYDPTMSGNALTRMFKGSWMMTTSSGPVNTHVSLLERSYDAITSEHGELLDKGTYLAIVELPVDVPMGVAKSKQKESLHVIRGKW